MGYKRDKDVYLERFIDSCFSPYQGKDVEREESDISQLEELLNYEWNLEKLKELESRGVKIEVYLGEKDVVIDVLSAKAFFLQMSTVTYVKNANHFLQTN